MDTNNKVYSETDLKDAFEAGIIANQYILRKFKKRHFGPVPPTTFEEFKNKLSNNFKTNFMNTESTQIGNDSTLEPHELPYSEDRKPRLGWINLYETPKGIIPGNFIYESEEDAFGSIRGADSRFTNYIKTVFFRVDFELKFYHP